VEPDRNVKKTVGFGVRRLALLSILTALCYVGRMVFQFIPNVQPVTAVLIILTLTLGHDGRLHCGHPVDCFDQLPAGDGAVDDCADRQFRRSDRSHWFVREAVLQCTSQKRSRRILFALFAFFGGLLYGFVISVISVKLMGINSFWAYYIAGIPFDLLHGLGNAGFYLILEPILAPLLLAQQKKT
jgi:energy-coupling factor transport system substrate-specific component